MMFSIDGKPVLRLQDIPSTLFGVTDTHYRGTVGVPLLRGRDFQETDLESTVSAAIVNQAFVNRYFPGEDPLGKRIELGAPRNLGAQDEWMGDSNLPVTVVGVMADSKNAGLALPVEPQLITLFKLDPRLNFGFKQVMVRSQIAPDLMERTMEQQFHAIDPRLAFYQMEPMTEYIEDQTSDQRFTGGILTSFAGLGLLLAVIGIFGVTTYLVAQRNQELGIRMALGASRSHVLWLIVRQGLVLTLCGVGIGVAGTALASQSLSKILYGVSSLDPFILSAASLFLLIVALVACVIPARRAAHIDPMHALRTE